MTGFREYLVKIFGDRILIDDVREKIQSMQQREM